MTYLKKETAPKISVLMPVFNCELYIKDSIESILNQTFTDFEFLIFDDGSTDKTKEIIEFYKLKDKRIKLIINEKNIGLTSSLNLGIKLARGQYIARMDGDDISLPQRFQKQIEYMDKFPEVGVSGTWIETFNYEKKTTVIFHTDSDLLKTQSIFGSPLAHPSVLIRKKILEKYQLEYDTSFVIAQDYDLWTRCLNYTEIGVVDSVLVKYRTFDPASRIKYIALQTQETKQIYTSILNKIGITPTEEQLNIHNTIGFKKKIATKQEFNKCMEWLFLLKEKTLNSALFPEKALLQTIQQYWFSICYSSTSLGFYALKKYLQHQAPKDYSTPIYLKLKFFIKILLRK